MSLKTHVTNCFHCVKSRTMVIFTFTFPAIINLLIVSRLSPSTLELIFTFLSVTFISYAVYWYNDYIDADSDVKNGEFGDTSPAQRPLAMGLISRRELMSYILITAMSGLILAYFINIYVFAFQLLYLILGYFYSTEPIRFKKRFIGKQLTILAGAILASLTGAYVYQTLLPQNIYCLIVNVLLYISAPSLADIRDLLGDKRMGVKTLPVVLGPEITVRFAIATFIAVILAGIVGYYNVGFNVALPILTTIIMVSWIYSIYPIIKKWEDSVFVENIIYKRLIPMNLIVQALPLIGLLAL